MKQQGTILSEFPNLPAFGLMACCLILPLIILLLTHPFDGLYGQDPYAYFDYATGPFRESLLQSNPIPPFFWPPGYPLLVAVFSLFVGIRPFAGQIVSLFAGVLVPIFTFLLAKEVQNQNRFIPLMAGMLVAFMPQLWQSSVVVMADTAGLAAATMGVWALFRYGKRPEKNFKWLALATAGVAFAVLTRWVYALTAILCGIYALWTFRQLTRRIAFFHLIGAAALAVGILAPVLGPALSVYLVPELESTSFTGDLQVYHWEPQNAFRREFVTGDGILRYSMPNGLYYAAVPAHRYFFTPLLAWLILPGVWEIVRKRDAAQWILLLGWAGIVYGFHAGTPWQNFRFSLAYLPPLAIIAAVGLGFVMNTISPKRRLAIGVILVFGWGWMAYGGWRLTESFILRKAAELETVAKVQRLIPTDAHLITFGLTLTFQHYTDLETLDIFSLNTDDLDAITAISKPTYLFLDINNIETQWVNRSPFNNYHWLMEGPGLQKLEIIEFRGLSTDDKHFFTLFEVQKP